VAADCAASGFTSTAAIHPAARSAGTIRNVLMTPPFGLTKAFPHVEGECVATVRKAVKNIRLLFTWLDGAELPA
jgi:hypothetical protein